MKKVGIIGAGQLGQMLGFAGRKLDLEFVFLDPSEHPPAAIVGTVEAESGSGSVSIRTLGGAYALDMLSGEQLPRIC